jgi:hypothetical protein
MVGTYDGNFILGGSSHSGATGSKTKTNRKGADFWLIKIDDKGQSLWQETYNTGNTDILTDIVENKDHSLFIAGYAMSETMFSSGKKDKEEINDFIAIKLNEGGEEQWKTTVGSSGEDILRRAIETRDGGYLLAGTSSGNVSRDKNSKVGLHDFWIVKFKDKDKRSEKPNIVEAIPNPAQQYSNVIVNYEYMKGTATLYDLGGRQLQSFPITERTIPINLTGLPEGIYLVNISTDKSSDSVKIIKSINN